MISWAKCRIYLICVTLQIFTLIPLLGEAYFSNTAHITMESFIQESILHVKSTPDYQLIHTTFWKFIWALYLNLEQVGLIMGGLATPMITHRFGRPRTGAIAICCAIPGRALQLLSAVPGGWPCIFIGKVVSNIGLGIILVILPVFVSEIGEKNTRNKLGLLNPLGHSFGALFGALMGLRAVLGAYDTWLYAYGLFIVLLFPALPILLLLPESPAYILTTTGDEVEVYAASGMACASNSLKFYHGSDKNLQAAKDDAKLLLLQGSPGLHAFWELLTMDMLVKPLLLAASVAIAYFPVTLIEQYSTLMIEHAGLDTDTAGLCSIFLKICSVCAFIACIALAGHLNRRKQLLFGYFGTCLCMTLLCFWQYLVTHVQWPPASIGFIVTLTSLQITLNFGIRPVYWVILPEMFPFRFRAVAKSTMNILSYVVQIAMSVSFLPLLFEVNYLSYLILSLPLWFCFTYCAVHFPETDNQDLHEVFMKMTAGMLMNGTAGGSQGGGELLLDKNCPLPHPHEYPQESSKIDRILGQWQISKRPIIPGLLYNSIHDEPLPMKKCRRSYGAISSAASVEETDKSPEPS